MLEKLKARIPQHHPIRLLYHKIMAILAAVYYRFPADQMTVIGVTGTNGKTTTCHLIFDILREAGYKAGMLTTADFHIEDQVFMNNFKMTTLPPFKFQKLLRWMADRGCKYAVVEVTSHAMDQSRMWGVSVDMAVFTNLTHDHLDYHANEEEYVKAKGKLFGLLNFTKRKSNVPKISVINADDPQAHYFEQFVADRVYLYGMRKGSYQALAPSCTASGSRFVLKVPNDQAEIEFPLPGNFNIENALAAATVGVALQINLQTIQHALSQARPVPGRIERIDEGQKYSVIVDYAHAPDSLEKLLAMFRKLTKNRLIMVFGATGDRDRTKRPKMGQIVDKYADEIILTDDDPYTEDNLQIIEEVSAGINRLEGSRFWKIPNRRQAIRLGLAMAREGDTVIVAGKGCEPFQVVGKKHIPSDDRQIVRNFLGREVEIEIFPGQVERGNRYMES
ncbi:UDP-N-acetylmuramoyl-L-alanyl-D-glutamate--2,6-diaminopimelate ligase [Candidatus Peregrinibacteria bacterium]|jgi:UDP-N-acetylmuramoyl-L-alanyl-D-glutamate--2,6-diaminopimelate ligase|nr:UDP-N-acetylmuramoyl-L-alanyl-D-glutamate--2,6-diaminopimelate ligase [Candidatus Peregrinibacteria bacterium]MBT7703490.1 UDP-N-acetylmuramoyl-L-alanyl-D-glutamate--2,6-diaminopimelate ligase [Candidatus Peregrinibacteria bacterium]